MPIAPNVGRSPRAAFGPLASPASIPSMPSACCSRGHAGAGGARPHPAGLWPGSDSHPVAAAGMASRLSTFWNTPAWTMSTEAFFYLLFPWLITRRRPRQARTMLLILLAVWLCALVLPRALHALQSGWRSSPRPLFRWHLDAGVEIHAAATPASFLFGMALGFLNEKIRPESRKRLALGIFAFAALYLLLCVGDRLPYAMMHDGLLMPLFAGVILCLAGRNPIAFLWAASLYRHRRGQLLPVPAALQSLDAAARLAFSGEERPDRLRSLDLLPAVDHRCAADQEAHRAAGKKLDHPAS
jgi:hypothetical protein